MLLAAAACLLQLLLQQRLLRIATYCFASANEIKVPFSSHTSFP